MVAVLGKGLAGCVFESFIFAANESWSRSSLGLFCCEWFPLLRRTTYTGPLTKDIFGKALGSSNGLHKELNSNTFQAWATKLPSTSNCITTSSTTRDFWKALKPPSTCWRWGNRPAQAVGVSSAGVSAVGGVPGGRCYGSCGWAVVMLQNDEKMMKPPHSPHALFLMVKGTHS